MHFQIKFRQIFSFLICFSVFTVQSAQEANEFFSAGSGISSVMTGKESFQLQRVQSPAQAMLEKEQQAVFKRTVTKYAVTVGVAVSVAIVLLAAYGIREAAKESKKLEFVAINKADTQAAPNPTPSTPMSFLTPLWWLTGSVKSFARDSSEFVANSATMLASGMVLNGATSFMQQKLSAVHQDETVLWYIAEHTKINQVFSDLKTNAIEYDLYATLLCAEVFNQDAQTHMRAFVKDLVKTTKDYNAAGNNFQDDNYFDFLLTEVKKKYMRQGSELEALQAYVVPTVAKRHRAQASGQAEELFVLDINRRKDIADLCQQLARDVEKLTAFMHIRFVKTSDRVQQLIDSCNGYIASMESLLNASPEALAELSKADRGMFTCSYEYERIFNQQVGYMHRYCRLVE
ncbi:MAG: hypothetical protein NTZ68_04110 [Candidatus Dependentiae bacterium]|nr:hypothetical protein [Candidatus Dependentiae bacterium]